MSFETLGLAPELLQAVRDCGYTAPTPIQEQAIPYLLAGRDLMGCAQTGTGKTAAFALPILHQMRGTPPGHLRALALVPTRELAIQVGRSIREYGEPLGIRSTAVYGGVPIAPQEMMLRHGVDFLVATPGRLKDHIWRGLIDFKETRFLVLDEADRMLDMGFIDAVREIVALIPRERQTMLFSATLEAAIVRLAKDILRNPVRVEVAPASTVADGIEHVMVQVHAGSKKNVLLELIERHQMFRTLVFTRTRRGASRLAVDLKRGGHRVSSIHSDKTQVQRLAALEAFREGKIDFLVATDIAARGLDVEGISHVVNFDLPRNAEDYVHRIGRTARAGHTGVAISLVGPEDGGCVRSIEQLIGRSLSADGTAGSGPAARPKSPLPRLVAAPIPPRPRARGGTATVVRFSSGRDDAPVSERIAAVGSSRGSDASPRGERDKGMGSPRLVTAGSKAARPQGSDMPRPVQPARSAAVVRSAGPAGEARRSGTDGRQDRGPVNRTSRDPRSRTGERPRSSSNRQDSRRGATGPRRSLNDLAPARGYVEKDGPLRRVLARLGFAPAR